MPEVRPATKANAWPEMPIVPAVERLKYAACVMELELMNEVHLLVNF
jgi:hypothetical protein